MVREGSAPTRGLDLCWRDPIGLPKPMALRVIPGPQAQLFPPSVATRLLEADWRVARESDRIGIRLEAGGTHPVLPPGIPPEGTTLGAIQATPDGGLILLGPDRPVTGGYAKPFLLAAADLGRASALRPGDSVHLRRSLFAFIPH